MSHTVVLPALGESVTEGTVTRWLVEVGDTIEVDAPLVEVSTDKVDTEVPSPVAGVVEQILVPEDEDVAKFIHAHPTQNESLGEAAMLLNGTPLHSA